VQQALLKQTSLPEHDVVGQEIVWPQLFVTVTPHALPQAAVLSGVQHVLSLWQTPFPGHAVVLLTPQFTLKLQLFTACPHCWLPQAWVVFSGMHPQAFAVHVPPSQPPQSMPLLQLSTVLPQRPAQ
jgi:hypothetical protein